MKKYAKLVLCMAAALMAAGCAKKDSGESSSAGAQTTAAETSSAAAAETSSAAKEEVDKGSVTKLGNYKGIELARESTEVTDEELEGRIQSILDANPQYVEVDREAKDGDTVNIDYVGLKDGVAFDGGTAQGFDLELGSDTFIDGFEDGLLGARAGDERSLNLTFPEEYGKADLAGQAVVFDVTVNAVKEKQEAVLDEAFVQRVSAFKTVDEFREDNLADLRGEKETQAEMMLQDAAMQAVVDGSEFDINPDAVQEQYEERMDYHKSMGAIYGMEMEDYISMYGLTMEAFEDEVREESEIAIKQQLVMEAIADAENMEVTDEDRKYVADQLYMDLETLKANYPDELESSAMSFKVLRFVVDHAVVKGD